MAGLPKHSAAETAIVSSTNLLAVIYARILLSRIFKRTEGNRPLSRVRVVRSFGQWGWNVVAYFVYHIVGLRVPQFTMQHSTEIA